MGKLSLLAADAVLVLHGCIVAFNVGALPIIWLGYFRKWNFVRQPFFRIVHLVLVGFVTAEAALGLICPLTLLENRLRQDTDSASVYQGSFVSHWLGRLLYWDISQTALAMMYAAFFALVVLAFIFVRPARIGGRMRSPSAQANC